MLAYAMLTLCAVSFAALLVYVRLYLSKREPRYLYLFCTGWAINGLAPLLYWLLYSSQSLASRRLVEAGFGAAQLIGPMLLILGVFSYFRVMDARRVGIGVLIGGAALAFVYLFVPNAGVITIILENTMLFVAGVYGLSQRQRFQQVAEGSYYLLVFVLLVGIVAALNWARYTTNDPAHTVVVMPWIGTTVTVILVAFFCMNLEHAAATQAILGREVELRTYRDHLEQLVEDRTEQLKRANAAKDEFLASMSHELRTPLNAVIGFSGVLAAQASGPLNGEQLKQVEMISAAGRHLLELIEQVLEFSRIESTAMVVKPVDFEVAPLVEGVVSMVRPMLRGSEVVMTWRVAAACERLHSDPLRLQQVLLNVVGNAAKYTSSGEIEVEVEPADASSVCFTVRDTGMGMTAEELSRAFEDFYQAAQPAGMKHHGTGLGLPISMRIAERLGGRIEAESEPGVGSVFRVYVARELREQ